LLSALSPLNTPFFGTFTSNCVSPNKFKSGDSELSR
jgi:hypothetical protein